MSFLWWYFQHQRLDMSSLLFHGPSAREEALRQAESLGRLIAPPFGEGGLKVSVAREIAEKMESAPMGDALGTILIGPFDDVTPEAADGLLKTLEEFDSRYLQPILWAGDIGSVIGTIRSRCMETWCPPPEGYSPDAPLLDAARSLCKASLKRRYASVVEHMNDHQGQEYLLLRASCEVLATEEDWPLKVRLLLWGRIRKVLVSSNGHPSPLSVLTAYLV